MRSLRIATTPEVNEFPALPIVDSAYGEKLIKR